MRATCDAIVGTSFSLARGLLIGVEFWSGILVCDNVGRRLRSLMLPLTLFFLLPLLVQLLLPLLESIIALGHWDAPRW
jgi:hypothetical protein